MFKYLKLLAIYLILNYTVFVRKKGYKMILSEAIENLENLTSLHNQMLESQTNAQVSYLKAQMVLNMKEASLNLPGANPGKNDNERNAIVTTECAVEIETLSNLKNEFEIAKMNYQIAYTNLQSNKLIFQSWFGK